MTYLVLDVETLPRRPPQKGMEWASPRDALVGNWIDAHKTVKPGLHPLFSEVAVISHAGFGVATHDALTEGGELGVLKRISEFGSRPTLSRQDTLVTFNGFGFDLLMLNTRLALHGLPALPWDTNPWHHGQGHYDVMLALSSQGKFPNPSLEVAYAWLIGDPPERPDLETAQAAWLKGDPVPLRTRCEADVRMTEALYRRLAGR